MKVLLTCVGKSDPMTVFKKDDTIAYDGAILHICRYKKPEKVYFYLSKQICEYHDFDNRYEKSIQLLNEQLNMDIETEFIERRDLVNVHRFDIFFDDFEKIINDIIKECGADTEILLNVSSGTPAMKTTLQTLALLSKFKLIPMQVSDPTKGKDYRNVDLDCFLLEECWKNNLDNINDEDRTFVSANDSLNVRVQREMIIKLISSYDYEAAYQIVNEYQRRLTKNTKNLIELAYSRYYLDFQSAFREDNELQLKVIPYHDKLFEYGLWMKIKYDKGEIIDFIRGLNPFMYETCFRILEKKLNIDILSYCSYKKRKDTYYLERNKLNDELGKEILQLLDKKYYPNYRDAFLSEMQMITIIKGMIKDDRINKAFDELNNLREKYRNKASHTICTLKKKDIETQKKDVKKSLKSIQQILSYLNFDVKKYWNSYDTMNEIIIEELGKVV